MWVRFLHGARFLSSLAEHSVEARARLVRFQQEAQRISTEAVQASYTCQEKEHYLHALQTISSTAERLPFKEKVGGVAPPWSTGL